MPNWWMQWAERIALVLAELWTRSSAAGTGPGAAPADRPASSSPDAPDAPPAPDANPP
jgi:hypothetical protein